jgi:hypothetical protein
MDKSFEALRQEADLEQFAPPDPILDPRVRRAVLVLRSAGIETFQSTDTFDGRSPPEPTVRFWGDQKTGLIALGLAVTFDLPMKSLRCVWAMRDRQLTGPWWEMTFTE